MNREIAEGISNKDFINELLDILKQNDETGYETAVEILEGMSICNFKDISGRIITISEKIEETDDYRIKALIINILLNTLDNLIESYADRYDVDFSREDVDYIYVNYGQIKIEKSYCYSLFDQYIDVVNYYNANYYNSDRNIKMPDSIDISSSSVKRCFSVFSYFGLNRQYMCKKLIEVFGEEYAHRYILRDMMCNNCKKNECSIYKKYEREIRLEFRLKIMGFFVSITRPELGKAVEISRMGFLGSSYHDASVDTFDFLRFSEDGITLNVITEEESAIIREIYYLYKKLYRKEISDRQLEEECLNLYKRFFGDEDVFSVICRLPE